MKCSQIRRKLSAFMDRELDDATSRLVGQHLDACRECLEYLHEFGEVDGLVHGLPKVEVSPDFFSRVVSAAIVTSDVARRESAPFAFRLQRAAARLSDAVFSLFEQGAAPATRTLDEFSDCPPLSMSFVYFKLLDQGSRG